MNKKNKETKPRPPVAPQAEDRDELDKVRSQKHRRKHLDERLSVIYKRAQALEEQLKDLDDRRFYRVCIFGSARIKPDTKEYQDAFQLARFLAWDGIDVLTGGGPGLMEAANRGVQLGEGEKKSGSLSFGLSIQLDFEPEPNMHLDVTRHHHKFSSRLDDFMRLSHAVVATPGGIGTVLELMFAWQLIQVKHMAPRPLVLMDKGFWTGFIEWLKNQPLARGLMGAKDFDVITIVDTPEEVYEVLQKHHQEFQKNK